MLSLSVYSPISSHENLKNWFGCTTKILLCVVSQHNNVLYTLIEHVDVFPMAFKLLFVSKPVNELYNPPLKSPWMVW